MTMIRASVWGFCALAAAYVLAADDAATVTVRSVHLCCGGCSKAAKEALEGIDGVSEIKADVNSKTVVFAAKDEKAALKGLESLAENGFFGKAAFGKKDLEFPDAGAKKGEKRDTITLSGVHLCCGACKTAVKEAMTAVPNMNSLELDASANTVKLTGAGMLVTDAVNLLQKAGFYGKVEKSEKK